MTPEELKANLCVYDQRSPHYHPPYKDETKFGGYSRPSKLPECHCDYCFRGKAQIAEYALELHGELRDLKKHLGTIGTLRDLRELKGDV